MAAIVIAGSKPIAKKTRTKKRKAMALSEDRELIMTLEELKKELRFLYNRFDNVTDPILIDGCIYEIKALHMKYKYYLKQCKERNIVN